MKELKTPVSEDTARKLKLGDVVHLTGTVATARDRAHQRALEGDAPTSFNVVYHSGPLAKKNEGWSIVSAGPTTSARMDHVISQFMERFKPRIIIGKGGMGRVASIAFQKHGCAYLAFTGGAGALAAERIKGVEEVHWLDLGMPEAVWVLEVEKLGPLVVAMDARGNSLFES